jgi:predicted transporter
MGVVAYAQLFALLESVLLAAALITLGLIFPPKWMANKMVAQSTTFVFITSVWFVALQYNYQVVRAFSPVQLLLWVTLYLSSIVFSYFLVRRSERVEAIILSLTKRLAVLAAIYVAFSVFSAVVVVLRNIV